MRCIARLPTGVALSVVQLLRVGEVCDQIDRLLPPVPQTITAPLRAPPVTRNYALVGTAFDYALRFELSRRYPHVRCEPWIAEAALGRMSLVSDDPELWLRAENLVASAKVEVDFYRTLSSPSLDSRKSIASQALRLAKLDLVYREQKLDPEFESADPLDVADILRLLDAVPYEGISDPKVMWLNPTFGRYSALVGGADCDLVSGGRLIDIKVTMKEELRPEHLRQLVSYAILGRGVRRENPEWPDVREVGIYFARHGYLWTLPADRIFEHPAYHEVEDWYFAFAAKLYGRTLEELATARIARREAPPKPSAREPHDCSDCGKEEESAYVDIEETARFEETEEAALEGAA